MSILKSRATQIKNYSFVRVKSTLYGEQALVKFKLDIYLVRTNYELTAIYTQHRIMAQFVGFTYGGVDKNHNVLVW